MAEVKWPARRISDGVLVDVTADVTGTPFGAPTPNALEGGGDGEAFNGGTITTPLVIENTADEVSLSIRGMATQSSSLFTVGAGGTPFTDAVDVQGGPAGTIGGITLQTDGSGSIDLNSDTVFVGPDIAGASGTVEIHAKYMLLAAGSIFRIARISAPADADIGASTVALWFDATNGAAKLMIKGKSANGTVVTGAVNLT